MHSYGEHGAAVITNTLMSMYNLLTAGTITSASQPLTFAAYTRFILVPFIAALLISQDEDTDIEGAWEIMQKESDHGDDENSSLNDDPVLDDVFAANAK